MLDRFMEKLVRFLDPKFEKYRSSKNVAKNAPELKYTPKTLEDFIGVLRRTPKSILTSRDRARISAIMSFDDRKIENLMIPKSQMIFVKDKEMLGPLILDKLYKSGFTNFPVINEKEKVVGVIHTEALNTLEIKKTARAEKYIDKNVYYLHTTDSLNFAVEEIERTNSYYFFVLDQTETLAGFFTIQMLLDYLLN